MYLSDRSNSSASFAKNSSLIATSNFAIVRSGSASFAKNSSLIATSNFAIIRSGVDFVRSRFAASVLALLALLPFSVSCSEKQEGEEEVAAAAALGYYSLLLEGDYGAFVDGLADTDSIPASHREELEMNMAAFSEQQEQARNGMKSVRIVTAKKDSTLQAINVMLLVCYGDSVSEEVCVPMVKVRGEWKMK